METKQIEFLNLAQKPARLTGQQAGWLLGFTAEEMIYLYNNSHLPPLGQPGTEHTPMYALSDVLTVGGARDIIEELTQVLQKLVGEANFLWAQTPFGTLRHAQHTFEEECSFTSQQVEKALQLHEKTASEQDRARVETLLGNKSLIIAWYWHWQEEEKPKPRRVLPRKKIKK
jgi:hypothetical protein